MSYNLTNVLAKRPTKEVYRDGENTIKLFVENYSKANILNEALIQARVEEGTDLNIPKLNEVTKIDGRWALVSDYVEGTTLEQLMIDHPDKIDEYLDLFVEKSGINKTLIQILFQAEKSAFNKKYDIKIKGLEAEIYVEDVLT